MSMIGVYLREACCIRRQCRRNAEETTRLIDAFIEAELTHQSVRWEDGVP
jgi:hypothetical protein